MANPLPKFWYNIFRSCDGLMAREERPEVGPKDKIPMTIYRALGGVSSNFGITSDDQSPPKLTSRTHREYRWTETETIECSDPRRLEIQFIYEEV